MSATRITSIVVSETQLFKPRPFITERLAVSKLPRWYCNAELSEDNNILQAWINVPQSRLSSMSCWKVANDVDAS